MTDIAVVFQQGATATAFQDAVQEQFMWTCRAGEWGDARV